MFAAPSASDYGVVLIRLTFDSQDPPVGSAVLDDGLEQPFEGTTNRYRTEAGDSYP